MTLHSSLAEAFETEFRETGASSCERLADIALDVLKQRGVSLVTDRLPRPAPRGRDLRLTAGDWRNLPEAP